MPPGDGYCHTASVEIRVPARVAFDYVAQPLPRDDWTLGSWDRREAGEGLVVGRSLFDGREAFVRIDRDPERLLVSYLVGPSPEIGRAHV